MTRARSWSLALSLAVVTLFSAVLAAGCGRHVHGRKELEEAASRHYLDLRWGRIPSAAARVHPDMRGPFVEDWAQRAGDVELQDLEVVDVREDLENDRAEVIVAVSFVDRSSMQLRSRTITQVWVRTDDGWLAMSDLDLR